MAYATLHGGGDHWRFFVAICTAPCIISTIAGFLSIPESARWLAAKGRNEMAVRILRRAAVSNGHEADDIFPPGTVLVSPEGREHVEEEGSILDLFQPKWLKTTLTLWVVWASASFGYYGTVMAETRVFSEGDSSTSPSLNTTSTGTATVSLHDVSKYDFDYSAIFVSASAEFVGTTLAIFVVDRMGRVSPQVISYGIGGMSISLVLFLSTFHTHRYVLVALAFVARIFEMSGTCILWVTTAEVLTTDVRGAGHSTSNALGRVGAIMCDYLIVGNTSKTTIAVIMLLSHTLSLVGVALLPETKGHNMGDGLEDPSDRSHETQEDEVGDEADENRLV